MKNILKFIMILFLSFHYNSSNAQQMVQNINEIYRLKNNQEQFINKPLKNLLKELKPEIKTVIVLSDNNSFCFKFITLDQIKKDEGSVEDRVTLFVDVKECFDWKWKERTKGRETIWTKEDLDKYGNLIIADIEIVSASNE